MQYTYARLKSILRKNQNPRLRESFGGQANDKFQMIDHAAPDDLEHRILAGILRFPEVIEDALREFAPNTLANYLYGLAKLANEFYHSHPVLQEEDAEKKQFRTALISGISNTLKNGLYLLGIDAPEEM